MKRPFHLVVGGSRGGDDLPYWKNLPNVTRHEFDAFDGTALGHSDHDSFLNVTRSEGGSSLLYPDLELVRDWMYNGDSFANALEVVKRIPVEVIRLDSWCRENFIQPDFISLNIQGSEFAALVGSVDVIDGVLGLQLEMTFVPYYLLQPSLGAVVAWLDRYGFDFHAILSQNKMGRMSRPGVEQLFESHCLWLRRGSNEALDIAQEVYQL